MEGKTKNQSRSQRAKVVNLFGFAGMNNYRGTIDLQMAGEAAKEKDRKSIVFVGVLKPLINL